jgi:acetyl esterase
VGSLDTHDRIMRLLAKAADRTVIGVDYPLAPEHKFPLALDLVMAFCRELAAGAGAIALAGDSAGANLALAVALALRGAVPIEALLLYYGAFGLRDSASRRLYGGEIDGLGEAALDFYRDAYLRSPADRRDPRHDLLVNDLAGLPPTFVAAAAFDPLLDDSHALAGGLAAASVRHRLMIYEGVLHGFLHLSRTLPTAHEAITAGGRFLATGA